MVNPFKREQGRDLVWSSYQRLLGQWDVPVREEDVPTAFGLTHVVMAGAADRPPLILFHGVGDNSAMMWIYNIAELSKHFCVYAVDTIGGPGRSVPNDGYGRAFDQAVWIDEILRFFGLTSVYVAGVSNGAYLAGYYAVTHPDKVNRVVGMAGGVKVNMLKMMTVFLPEALYPASERTTRKLLRKLCAPGMSRVFEEHEELMTHWTYLLKYFNNRAMMVHKYRKFTTDERAILREKALYLIGEYDRLSNYPAAIRELEQSGIPYRIIPNAGHGVNHEQAEHVNREMIGSLLG